MGKKYEKFIKDSDTMSKRKIDISIVIVYYRAKKELFDCIQSVRASKPKMPYEVIVVDNDEQKTIKKELFGRFPFVTYIASSGNIGFGAGNNLGVSKSRGEFLFFLNPDTLIEVNTLETLYEFIKKDNRIGIVAPLLLGERGLPLSLQGFTELTPVEGVVSHSFINRYFPNNPVSRKYFLLDWDKKAPKEVDVIPGAAFLIRRSVFEKVSRFDERFFLYFEESDLCRRVRKLGYKIYIEPKAHIVHLWARSTQDEKRAKQIFVKSRFYYFKKHFGLFWAVIVHIIASIGNPFKR